MNILFITLDYPPDNFGGSGISANDTVKLLSQRHKVHVLTIGIKSEVEQQGGNLYIHRFASSYLPFFRLPSFLFQLNRNINKIINKYKIDIIHINDVEGCFFLNKLPSVVTINHLSTHNFSKVSLTRNIKNIPYVFMERVAINNSSHIIAISHTTQSEIICKYKNTQHKISIVYPPIHKQEHKRVSASKIKNDYGISSNKLLILAPGIMRDERKGGTYLIKSLEELVNKDRFICIFTGESREGNWDQKLKNQAKSLLGSIKFVGNLEYYKFYNLLSISDIVVFPSIFEGYGLPVAEAMLMKKPVIATKTGEISYLINHGVDGFLINPRDSKNMCKYLYKLLSQKSLRTRMGIEAHNNISKKINNTQILNNLENIYTRILPK